MTWWKDSQLGFELARLDFWDLEKVYAQATWVFIESVVDCFNLHFDSATKSSITKSFKEQVSQLALWLVF